MSNRSRAKVDARDVLRAYRVRELTRELVAKIPDAERTGATSFVIPGFSEDYIVTVTARERDG